MSDWRTAPLGSFVEFQRGIDITRATQNAGDIPVVSSGGISSYHNAAHSPGPGVVIGRKGTIGNAFYLPGPYWPHDTTLWVREFNGNDPKFVYYFMSRLDVSWLEAGSANPTLNRNHLHPVVVTWPGVPEQRAIAEVLGALDDKIAANSAIARSTDALVRAMYEALEGENVLVGDVALFPRDGVDPASVRPDDLYVGLEHVGRRHMWLGEAGQAGEVSSTKLRFVERDILFGKLRPYFHKVASAPREGICSTDILVVRVKDQQVSSVLLAALTSDAVIQDVVAASEGTRMPRTSWRDLASVEIKWPDSPTAARLASQIDSIRGTALHALNENRTLATTRDALLPQLMSGKLRVRDAEAIAADAGA